MAAQLTLLLIFEQFTPLLITSQLMPLLILLQFEPLFTCSNTSVDKSVPPKSSDIPSFERVSKIVCLIKSIVVFIKYVILLVRFLDSAPFIQSGLWDYCRL